MSKDSSKSTHSRLRIVGDKSNRPTICDQLSALSAELSPIHMENSELHQLWLETQWLKADCDRGVLCAPAHWEMTLFKIARGQASPSLLKYPVALALAKSAGTALQRYFDDQKEQPDRRQA